MVDGTGQDDARDVVRDLEDDLASVAAADAALERDAEVAERTRIERGAITLSDRLRGATGEVGIKLPAGVTVRGPVVDVGDGWVLVRTGLVEHLVPLTAVQHVRGLAGAAPATSAPRSLGSVLREWCRDRSEVVVRLVDGTSVNGRADAAYGDHLDVADTAPVSVALAAVVSLTRSAPQA